MHKSVNSTLFLDHLSYQPFNTLNLCQITDIAAVSNTFQLLVGGVKLLLIAVKQDDLSAMCGQQGTNSLPHATGSASDKYLFTCKI